jgi:hypothetical protein
MPLDVPSTFEQAGQVFLLSLKVLTEKHHVILSRGAEYVSLFEGNLSFGRFGWHVTWQDLNNDGFDDLILGSPYQTQDVYNTPGKWLTVTTCSHCQLSSEVPLPLMTYRTL